MSEYESVQKGALKFKGVADSGIKKKKKKKKDKDREKAAKMIEQSDASTSKETSQRRVVVDKRTDAEIAFAKATEKRNAEMILQKASKSHKERIMDFNERLDGLTEHFDIPKVSWTK